MSNEPEHEYKVTIEGGTEKIEPVILNEDTLTVNEEHAEESTQDKPIDYQTAEVVNCGYLSIRQFPSGKAPVLCVVEAGTVLNIIDNAHPSFAKVSATKYEDETIVEGFAMRQFLHLGGE